MQSKLIRQRLVSYHLFYTGDKVELKTFDNGSQGFSLFTYESDEKLIYIQSADNSVDIIEKFCKKLDESEKKYLKDIYQLLSGAFQVFIWDKKEKSLKSICDYLGVCATLYMQLENDSMVFFPNYLYFSEFKKTLKISRKGALAHFGFGYHVEPFSYIFEGISTLQGRKLLSIQNGNVEENDLSLEWNTQNKSQLANNFENALSSSLYKDNYFIGVTAGKDSLAILSTIKKGSTYKTGNFGSEKSGDVLQGEIIAKELGLPFQTISLCNAQEFDKYAHVIANTSGGLATCSYVDMLKFTDISIAKEDAYLMGEGGESIRSFFDVSSDDISKAMQNYITPKEFLEACFCEDMCPELKSYPNILTNKIAQVYEKNTLSKTLMHFYRFGRMPGNFSNRHRILNRYRDKCIPFLNSSMIQNSFGLEDKDYDNDGIHREIVKQNNDTLLGYFDKPMHTSESVQDWNKRIQGPIGKVILELLENNLDALSDIVDKKRVLDFTKEEIKSPGRGIYFIFRVLSLALFYTQYTHDIKKEAN